MVLAERAHDADAIRSTIAETGAWANIPPMPQRAFKPAFSKVLYRARNRVERFFNKIKHFRAIATRYDKRDDNYLASIKLAAIQIWLRHNESVTWSVAGFRGSRLPWRVARLPPTLRARAVRRPGSAYFTGIPPQTGLAHDRRADTGLTSRRQARKTLQQTGRPAAARTFDWRAEARLKCRPAGKQNHAR
jgi:transposase